jgi:hypothetical protein
VSSYRRGFLAFPGFVLLIIPEIMGHEHGEGARASRQRCGAGLATGFTAAPRPHRAAEKHTKGSGSNAGAFFVTSAAGQCGAALVASLRQPSR